MKIKITADRMIDLKPEDLEQLNIATMSCYINMGGKSYDDMLEIVPDDVFKHLEETGEIAKTAAKSPDAYYEFFKQFTDEGYSVIHFACSSGISAICSHAIQASERLPNVLVIDTKTLSNGIALLVWYAIDLINKGETDLARIRRLVLLKREMLQGSFLIDSLECLHKGGRCSGLTLFGANLLKIKPAITMDSSGKMVTREKNRGNIRRALEQYVKNTFEKYPNPDLRKLCVIHFCKDEEIVQFFLDTVAKYAQFESIYFGVPSCNSGVHSGVDTFACFYFTK